MCWRNLSQTIFLKNPDWGHLSINGLKFYTLSFFVCPWQGRQEYFKTKVLTTCLYVIQSFKKKQKRSRARLLASFYAWFFKKRISHVRPTSKLFSVRRLLKFFVIGQPGVFCGASTVPWIWVNCNCICCVIQTFYTDVKETTTQKIILKISALKI